MGIADIFHFPDSRVTICYAANLASWNYIDPLKAYAEIWDEVTHAVFILREQRKSEFLQGSIVGKEKLRKERK
jgi:hypothetical protein